MFTTSTQCVYKTPHNNFSNFSRSILVSLHLAVLLSLDIYLPNFFGCILLLFSHLIPVSLPLSLTPSLCFSFCWWQGQKWGGFEPCQGGNFTRIYRPPHPLPPPPLCRFCPSLGAAGPSLGNCWCKKPPCPPLPLSPLPLHQMCFSLLSYSSWRSVLLCPLKAIIYSYGYPNHPCWLVPQWSLMMATSIVLPDGYPDYPCWWLPQWSLLLATLIKYADGWWLSQWSLMMASTTILAFGYPNHPCWWLPQSSMLLATLINHTDG
jgi:hypothetical protein